MYMIWNNLFAYAKVINNLKNEGNTNYPNTHI